MRFVIQRSRSASVTVDGRITGSIEKGFTVLIGVSDTDTETTADKLIRKMLGLRIFEDSQGKTNVSLKDAGGSLLLISQFTLYADCRKGNRPSFINAGKPDKAERLYNYIIDKCRTELDKWNKEKDSAADSFAAKESKRAIYKTETGIFGADMKVSLTNDGPFTIILDSDDL